MSILFSLIKDIFRRKDAQDSARLNELLSSLQTLPAPESAQMALDVSRPSAHRGA